MVSIILKHEMLQEECTSGVFSKTSSSLLPSHDFIWGYFTCSSPGLHKMHSPIRMWTLECSVDLNSEYETKNSLVLKMDKETHAHSQIQQTNKQMNKQQQTTKNPKPTNQPKQSKKPRKHKTTKKTPNKTNQPKTKTQKTQTQTNLKQQTQRFLWLVKFS